MENEIYKEITKGVRKPLKNKVALFLCGAAGTGKTNIRNIFLKDVNMQTTFVVLNIDDIRPYVGSQEASRTVFQNLMNQTIQDEYSFLYDGTCRDKSNILQRIQELKRRKYKIVVGITYASLGTVLTRIQQRTTQPLDESTVRDIYAHLKKNVETYMSIDGIDELYLYNNEKKAKLIFYKDAKEVKCISPDSKFYFDVSKYC